jgi:hypothetical protein
VCVYTSKNVYPRPRQQRPGVSPLEGLKISVQDQDNNDQVSARWKGSCQERRRLQAQSSSWWTHDTKGHDMLSTSTTASCPAPASSATPPTSLSIGESRGWMGWAHGCHTRFWKANRMRTMYVPGSELTYTAIT